QLLVQGTIIVQAGYILRHARHALKRWPFPRQDTLHYECVAVRAYPKLKVGIFGSWCACTAPRAYTNKLVHDQFLALRAQFGADVYYVLAVYGNRDPAIFYKHLLCSL